MEDGMAVSRITKWVEGPVRVTPAATGVLRVGEMSERVKRGRRKECAQVLNALQVCIYPQWRAGAACHETCLGIEN
jgi:hypothetical protein